MKPTKQEQTQALEALRTILEPGMEVYVIIRSVAPSGMSRIIDFYAPETCFDKPSIRWIGTLVAKVLGKPYLDKQRGIRVNGCGMDMAWAAVSELSELLWPEQFRNDEPDLLRRRIL